ncbi:MAG: hypothetical protein NPIRA06_28580 [Nitrospirales bacterium]|nr:MAG: hypothetical protein NPIRA06_28580 [Nitrospirales bacterium]
MLGRAAQRIFGSCLKQEVPCASYGYWRCKYSVAPSKALLNSSGPALSPGVLAFMDFGPVQCKGERNETNRALVTILPNFTQNRADLGWGGYQIDGILY